MHQENWQQLWNLFLTVMAAEPIHIRLLIGVALAFLTVMSLTGIVDSFLPRRAARRYAAMYDMMPAVSAAPPSQNFTFEPPSPVEEPPPSPEPEPDVATPQPAEPSGSGDLRFAEGVKAASHRRSSPKPPKVLW